MSICTIDHMAIRDIAGHHASLQGAAQHTNNNSCASPIKSVCRSNCTCLGIMVITAASSWKAPASIFAVLEIFFFSLRLRKSCSVFVSANSSTLAHRKSVQCGTESVLLRRIGRHHVNGVWANKNANGTLFLKCRRNLALECIPKSIQI